MLELVAGVLLAAGLVSFVLQPVWRPAAEPLEREQAGAGGWEEGEDPDDDLSPRAVALRALKEIEFDRATGKLSDSDYDALNRQVTAATLEIARDGKRLGVLTTEKRQHVDGLGRPTFQPSTEVGIRSDLREDLYIVLAGLVNGTEQAVFRFTINPLVWWVWYGGMIVALGGLIVMWPGGGSPAVKRAQAGYAVRLVGEQ